MINKIFVWALKIMKKVGCDLDLDLLITLYKSGVSYHRGSGLVGKGTTQDPNYVNGV